MIHVHLADRGTTTFSGSFQSAYQAAQAYIRAHAPNNEQIDDDRPEGISVRDWAFYCTPAKARIVGVLATASRPMLTIEIADAANVARRSVCRILRLMEKMGEARNVGVKAKAKWVRV